MGLILAPTGLFFGCLHIGHDHDHATGGHNHVLELCKKCGEIKGTDTCCKAEGRVKCSKCGLFEGSAGCCKIPKDAKGPVTICGKCGEIKGTDTCCKAEGRVKCSKCGLFKGSAGCCKLPKAKKE